MSGMGELIVLGRFGEEKAAKYLRKEGYEILEQNFRCKLGEIDIVAKKGDTIVFVEVKTRRSTSFGLPCEALTKQKRNHVLLAARHYIQKQLQIAEYAGQRERMKALEYRIDVVEVIFRDGTTALRHLRNAFTL